MFDSNFTSSKPIAHIITPDFSSDHIQQLVQELGKNSVPYNLQKEGDTLGQPLDRRFFVVVDNIKGTVVLGPEFSSLLMFVVGYPRRGTNKKNYYCKRAADVVQRYQQFRKLPQLQKINFSTYSIKTKSQLKTIKSIPRSRQSSSLLHNRSQSVNSKLQNQSIKLRSLTCSNEEKEAFLMRAVITPSKDKHLIQYNKVVSKIAVTNPDKYKIVQNYSQLKSNLEYNNSPDFYLLIHEESMPIINMSEIKNSQLLVFRSPKQKQMQNNKQRIEVQRVKYVGSFEQVLNQIRGIKKEVKVAQRSRIKMRKIQICNREQRQKPKGVAWANNNEQFKFQQTHSSKEARCSYYIKTYSQSQQQIAPSQENNPTLSRTEPEANQNVFANDYIRQQKALEEIQKEYYHINAPQPVEQNHEVSGDFTNVNRTRMISHLAHEKVVNLTIYNHQSSTSIKNEDVKRGPESQSPQDEAKQTIILKTIQSSKPRRIIKKVKRVNSQDTKLKSRKLDSFQENIQKPPLRISSKLLQRRFILPEQYCSPISPPSQTALSQQKNQINVRKNSKILRRIVRSYSEQPEIKYIENESPMEDKRLKKYKLTPLCDSNNLLIEPNSNNNLSQNNDKKSQLLLSTAGTEEDFLFVQSNLSRLDSGFQRVDNKNILNNTKISNEDPNFQTARFNLNAQGFGTFGNLRFSSKLKSQTMNINIQQKPPSLIRKIENQCRRQPCISSFSPIPPKRRTLAKPTCILWKEFNFDIEQGVNEINKLLDGANVRQHSFNGVSELQKIILTLPNQTCFIFMLDDANLDQFLHSIHKSVINQFEGTNKSSINKILGIYLFPKIDAIANIEQKLRNFSINTHFSACSSLSERIRVISSNDYYENHKLVAKDIINLIFTNA